MFRCSRHFPFEAVDIRLVSATRFDPPPSNLADSRVFDQVLRNFTLRLDVFLIQLEAVTIAGIGTVSMPRATFVAWPFPPYDSKRSILAMYVLFFGFSAVELMRFPLVRQ